MTFGSPAGITNVAATLKVIETPQFGPRMRVGETLTTSQVDLTLTVTVNLDLGGQRTGGLQGTIVVHPTGGSAVASPTAISCPTGELAPCDTVGVSVPQ